MDVSHRESRSYFLSLLKQLRKRPGMYIYPVTISSLRNFLAGYTCCNLFGDREGDFLDINLSFYDWIAMKESTRLTPEAGWVEVLQRNSSSEEDAFERFFQYLDEYLVREPKVLFEYSVSEKDRSNCSVKFSEEVILPDRLQIVSYDKNLDGVFAKYFNDKMEQVESEILLASIDDAYEYLNNTFLLSLPK
ncbi:MAG: hypothetical protein JKY66_11250 [Spongiibacteraceae bacterium]|nr:hypothetical protein [Spongiibacteraceae bacterium]